MNKFKQKLLWCFALIILCLAQINQTYAQENLTVKGTVVDENNDPLIGVSIGISGSQGGTRTDVNGNFQLQVPAKAKNLKFSYIGFDSKSVAISANMKVELKAASNTLDDVVVTGYQAQKKKDVTGAVSNISSKDFNQGNVTNSILQIQGKVAGLSIIKSTGDPTETPTIRLRGQTSLYGSQNPLIVVDGVQLDGIDQLNNIPPGDIETYDVLKDASATAVYGTRGANGVIIITTKKGVSGQPKIEYQGFTAFENQARYAKLLNVEDWRAVANPNRLITDNDFGREGTDWQRAITRQAFTQSHTIGLSGGNKGFTYRGTANYINQENIIINSGREQMGIRFNAQQKAFNDKLDVQISIANSITKDKGRNVGPQFINITSPAIPLFNADGSYNIFTTPDNNKDVLNSVERQVNIINKGRNNFTQYAAGANYLITKGLKAGVMGTLSTITRNEGKFVPDYTNVAKNIQMDNTAKRLTSTNESYRGELNLSYDFSWKKHSFSALSVYEYNYFTNNSSSAEVDRISFPFFEDNSLESGDIASRRISSNKNESLLISLLGRFNYNYDNKYYLTVSLRRDGSSKFGVNNQWATFPATNIAWRITQEEWMKDILWINDLKLRAGYGQTGNQSALSEYQARRLRIAGKDPVNGQVVYEFLQNENPDIQWEVRKGRNVGLDFAFFNSRLSGDINYFNDITDKLLFNYESFFAPTLPALPGKREEGKYITANVGSLSNKGLELALNFRAIQAKNFNWTIGGQISGVRTKIESLKDASGVFALSDVNLQAGMQNFTKDYITFLKEGYAPFVFYLPHYEGLDAEGKMKVSKESSYFDPSPRFNYGVSNTINYKNFSLNFFIRGVSGGLIYNSNASNIETSIKQRLTAGANTTYRGLEQNIQGPNVVSDYWLESASFLRMDNATLGYTFNKIKGVKNLKLYVAANNLFIITKYRGLDPEISTAASFDPNDGSQNYISNEESTPRTRSFSFGVNIGF
ncbi:MAG: SusC/RagA family TonB-linked outer membrane protein [Sphingobacteriales bacterium]|nr:MAG: SusC/RagA family TonB-linked outer membrane protein [Sphingobacteriales bacterium]